MRAKRNTRNKTTNETILTNSSTLTDLEFLKGVEEHCGTGLFMFSSPSGRLTGVGHCTEFIHILGTAESFSLFLQSSLGLSNSVSSKCNWIRQKNSNLDLKVLGAGYDFKYM